MYKEKSHERSNVPSLSSILNGAWLSSGTGPQQQQTLGILFENGVLKVCGILMFVYEMLIY